jgi:hypothetical protein
MKHKNNQLNDIDEWFYDHWLLSSVYILLMIVIFVGAFIFGYSMR